jgi:hypothetical protein
MAGGTHAFDMIKRLKENENLKKNNYYKKTKTSYKQKLNALNVDYISCSEEERKSIREKIKDDERKQVKKSLTILLLSVIIIAITGIYLLNFVKFNF